MEDWIGLYEYGKVTKSEEIVLTFLSIQVSIISKWE